MTENEALKFMMLFREDWDRNSKTKNAEALDVAIKALEKQIPYKPQEYEDKYYGCKCGEVLLEKWEVYPTKKMSKSWGLPYCLGCGQKLDWND